MGKKEPKIVIGFENYKEAKKIFSAIYGTRHDCRVKQGYMAVKRLLALYRFQILLGILGLIAALIFVKYILLYDVRVELQDSKKPFYLPNIAVMMVAITTALFTWWKNVINNKMSEIQESSRLDVLFAKAVDLLKKGNDLMTRKAGAHILRDLAVTSPNHAQICIDMLCSVNEIWMPTFLTKFPGFFNLNTKFDGSKKIEELRVIDSADKEIDYLCNNKESKEYKDDVELSMLVLLFIKYIILKINDDVQFKDRYNLQNKYLCGGDFQGVSFKKFHNGMQNVNFQFAYLDMADFSFVNLEHADFKNADITLANFGTAILNWTDFRYSKSAYANFVDAELRGTDFRDRIEGDSAFFGEGKNLAIFSNNDYKLYADLGVII
jgi:hypothetical protein